MGGLEVSLARRDWDSFEAYLLAAHEFPAFSYSDALIGALEMRSELVPNEDVLQVLSYIGDPETLPVLRETLWWRPVWDEFDQVAVKCIWAIGSIRNRSARDVLLEVIEYGSEPMRDWARSKLSWAI